MQRTAILLVLFDDYVRDAVQYMLAMNRLGNPPIVKVMRRSTGGKIRSPDCRQSGSAGAAVNRIKQ